MSWECPNCGHKANEKNFCGMCGCAKPEETPLSGDDIANDNEDENEIIISSGSSQAGGINDTGTINISSGSAINLHAPTINLDAENITLGHNPVKNVVTAQDLIPLLNMMKNNIIAKMPYGSPDLAPETFNSIGSNAVKRSG